MRRATHAAAALAVVIAVAGCGDGGGDRAAGASRTATETPLGSGGLHGRGVPSTDAASTAATAATTAAASTPTAPAPTRLTLRQTIGQRFVFAYAGLMPPRALERRIRRGEAAGVILFARNIRSVAQVRATVGRLQAIPRPAAVDAPLLVMVDHEGGPVRRLPGPPAQGAAQTPDARAARANGTAAGRLLRRAGVNVDLAPVVDVARPDRALANEGRTYDDDADGVIRKAGAFAEGLRASGVDPVLKHFPGFGAASINTDDGAARIDLPLSQLRAVDLEPYNKIPARAVMLSTAIYPKVDPRPAAFSAKWVRDELRGRLKFGGVTITDDLQTPAVARFGAPSQLAFFTMKAGVDLPLFAKDYATGARAAAGVEDAVRTGALPRAAVEAGARRVLRWRRDLGLQQAGR